MRALVVGGSGSGKSAFAERLACGLSARRTYVATMRGQGAEAQARIARHRTQRAGLGFRTLECTTDLPLDRLPAQASQGVALLEDVGNLAANALFGSEGLMNDEGEVRARLERQIVALSRAFAHTVVVGNEAGCEGLPDHEGTCAWLRLVGGLQCAVAADFDVVVEVVAGVPQVLKGVLW